MVSPWRLGGSVASASGALFGYVLKPVFDDDVTIHARAPMETASPRVAKDEPQSEGLSVVVLQPFEKRWLPSAPEVVEQVIKVALAKGALKGYSAIIRSLRRWLKERAVASDAVPPTIEVYGPDGSLLTTIEVEDDDPGST